MTISAQDLLIPFGTAKLPENGLVASGPSPRGGVSIANGVSIECQLPHVVVNLAGAEPLRLNHGPYHFPGPPPFKELAGTEDQLSYIHNYFSAYCDLWGKYQKLFLECYFDFIMASVEKNRADLTSRISEFGTLYNYKDWVFSAFRPLPQAHLWAPVDNGGTPPATPYDPPAMVAVDFAFWSGETIFVIDLVGTETRGRKRREQLDRLTRAGMEIVEVPHAGLGAKALNDLLPEAFSLFWEGEVLPSGPFKPDALALPVS